MAAKKKSFEQAVQRLETILLEMEKVETPLEDALKLYKEGIALSKYCSQILYSAEAEVTMLQQSTEGLFTEKNLEWE